MPKILKKWLWLECKFQVLQTSKAKTLSNERKGNEVNPDESGLKGTKPR